MTILYYTIGFYMVSLYTCGTAQNRDSQKLRIFINYGRNWSEFVKRACLTWRSLSYFPLGKNSAPPKEGAVFVRFEFFRLFSLYTVYNIPYRARNNLYFKEFEDYQFIDVVFKPTNPDSSIKIRHVTFRNTNFTRANFVNVQENYEKFCVTSISMKKKMIFRNF